MNRTIAVSMLLVPALAGSCLLYVADAASQTAVAKDPGVRPGPAGAGERCRRSREARPRTSTWEGPTSWRWKPPQMVSARP